MTSVQINIIRILTAVFFLIPIGALLFFIYRFIKKKLHPDKTAKRNVNTSLLSFAAVVILTISCSEISFDLYRNYSNPDESLGAMNAILKGIISGIRALGGETDYAENLDSMEIMMEKIGANFLVDFYPLCVSIVNFLAPIAGGAIILEVFARFFPKMRLAVLNKCHGRKKYFFSDLNNGSLALAESILENHAGRRRRPVIIFTDAYLDDENEQSAELHMKAENIGAFCINDDIAHFTQKRIKNIEYLLIKEDNEIENIKTLAALVEGDKYRLLENSTIRIFYQNDSFAFTENQIHLRLREKFLFDQKKKINIASRKFNKRREKLAIEKLMEKKQSNISSHDLSCKRCKKKLEKLQNPKAVLTKEEIKNAMKKITDAEVYDSFVDDASPVIIRTRAVQNLIYGVLEKTPLYIPLLDSLVIDNKVQDELNVGILGSGQVGIEMLLGTYWCGQLLDKKLGINMVSLEKKEDIVEKLDSISPEILQTSVPDSPILSVYDTKLHANAPEVYNDPYFTFRYCEKDVKKVDFSEVNCEAVYPDTAEIKETTGADKKNILDCDYFLVALGSDEENIVIAENLRRELVVKQLKDGVTRTVIIVCVVYDPSLCMLLNEGETSMLANGADSRIKVVTLGGFNDIYSFENIYATSSKARNSYNSYLEKSRKDLIKENKDRIKKAYDYYSSKANGIHEEYKSFSAFEYRVKNENRYNDWNNWRKETEKGWCVKDDELRQIMGWVEHRRWNAYIRSCGFRLRTNYEQKEVALKLHPCLVEAKHPSDKCPINDRLDDLSASKKHRNCPYKEYDLPRVVKK